MKVSTDHSYHHLTDVYQEYYNIYYTFECATFIDNRSSEFKTGLINLYDFSGPGCSKAD